LLETPVKGQKGSEKETHRTKPTPIELKLQQQKKNGRGKRRDANKGCKGQGGKGDRKQLNQDLKRWGVFPEGKTVAPKDEKKTPSTGWPRKLARKIFEPQGGPAAGKLVRDPN